LNSGSACGFDRSEARHSIDCLKVGWFCRARMRDADELDERVCGLNVIGVCGRIERVADERLAAMCGKLVVASGANQGANAAAAFRKAADQGIADVAGAAGDEDGGHCVKYDLGTETDLTSAQKTGAAARTSERVPTLVMPTPDYLPE